MRIAGLIIVLAALGLAGCKTPLESCRQTNKDYSGAQELPPLKAPPELEPPNTRNALKIPPLSSPERIRGKNEPCLDTPPPFTAPKAAEPQKPS